MDLHPITCPGIQSTELDGFSKTHHRHRKINYPRKLGFKPDVFYPNISAVYTGN